MPLFYDMNTARRVSSGEPRSRNSRTVSTWARDKWPRLRNRLRQLPPALRPDIADGVSLSCAPYSDVAATQVPALLVFLSLGAGVYTVAPSRERRGGGGRERRRGGGPCDAGMGTSSSRFKFPFVFNGISLSLSFISFPSLKVLTSLTLSLNVSQCLSPSLKLTNALEWGTKNGSRKVARREVQVFCWAISVAISVAISG